MIVKSCAFGSVGFGAVIAAALFRKFGAGSVPLSVLIGVCSAAAMSHICHRDTAEESKGVSEFYFSRLHAVQRTPLLEDGLANLALPRAAEADDAVPAAATFDADELFVSLVRYDLPTVQPK